MARKTAAFTLLELLCALVLSTTLLVAVMGVTGLMTRRAVLLKSIEGTPDWSARLEQQLRWEIVNSRRYWQSPHEFRLQGYASRDDMTDRYLQRPVDIRYQIETIAEVPWLTRTEAALDDLTNENPQRALVCPHISRLDLELPGEEPRQINHSGAIPQAFRLTLFDQERAVVDLRWIN